MKLKKEDWLSYKLQLEAAIKVHTMQGITNELILKRVNEEISKFPKK